MTAPGAGPVIESVDAILMRYFRDEATVEHAHAALLDEWREMQRPGAHGPAMLSLTKWAIRNAAHETNYLLEERTLHILLEPLACFFARE